MSEVRGACDEVWRPVVGFESRYEVSSLGRVRSLYSSRGPRKTPRVRKEWVGTSGYPLITFSVGGVFSTHLIHRLVLSAFEGRCPEGYEACHRDDVKTNNCLENLYWGSKADQISDARRNRTLRCGSRINTAKITEDIVRDIRERFANGETQASIRKHYGISRMIVHQVVRRKTWKHVTTKCGAEAGSTVE